MTITDTTSTIGAAPPRRAGTAARMHRALLGPAGEPRWARPALWVILAAAFALYAWGLSQSGYANSYYSAAVKSGTMSWKAFFFGALDSGSFITVDKPPMALWVMGLSARIFGFGTWSLLLPQVVEGVAAVAVLYATVRRAFGHAAAVTAAAVLALTPITVAINRDNNPDTLLVLMLVAAAWACQRAVATGRVRFLLLSAFFVGCGFNTKMLQAFLVVPTLALVYLVAARPGIGRRVLHLLGAGLVLAVSSFWWALIMDALPASSRPFMGGSTNGTAWNLIIGYNGFGRIFGENAGPGGGPGGGRGPGGGFGGQAGMGRLFNEVIGGQISWLIPFAVLALVAGLVLLRTRPRTDLQRAALLLWGGWLAVHYVIFSFAQGTFHPYYTTALGPTVGALTGAGAVLTFRASRGSKRWAWVLPAGVAVTGFWAYWLLDRTPSWHPWLRWVIVAATALAVVALVGMRLGRRLAVPVAVVGLACAAVAGLTGPAAFAASAAAVPTNSVNPLAGPSSGGFGFGPGGPGGRPPAGFFENGGASRTGGFPGLPPGALPPGAGQGFPRPGGPNGRAGRAPGGFGRFGGGPDQQADPKLVSYLEKNQGGATWLVAVSSSQQASPIILSTGKAVIAMGGFTGSDPAMTVAKLQRYVRDGKLHYVMLGGGFGRGGSSDVDAWVQRNGRLVKASEYGGTSGTAQQLYRLG